MNSANLIASIYVRHDCTGMGLFEIKRKTVFRVGPHVAGENKSM